MAHIHRISAQLNSSAKLPDGAQLRLTLTHIPLMQTGFNLPVSISTPKKPNPESVQDIKSATVMAHFDTGASKTSIDTTLATFLGLVPVGADIIHTAAGKTQMPNYAVDISFPGVKLAPFINLPIGSCNLPFKISDDGKIVVSPQNFGLLIGRDIMSRWNIVWNGPTTTVFISD